jgi:hypothetical protein
MKPQMAVLVSLILAACGSWSPAQDMPLVRKLLQEQLVAEMREHHDEPTAWINEKSKNKESWTSGKLLGKKIRLASWTEQSKTWLWLENPEESLQLEITRLEVISGRAHFALRAAAKARFKAWGRIPKLGQASVGGNTLADVEIEGSTAMANGGFENTEVTSFKSNLRDLRFNNDLAHPFEDLAKDALNDYARDKNSKLRRSVERAIDRVRFSKLARQ